MTRQSRAQFIADYLTSHLLPKKKTEQRQGAAVTRARTVPPRKPGPPPPRTLQTAEGPLPRPAGHSPINNEQVVMSAVGAAGISAVGDRPGSPSDHLHSCSQMDPQAADYNGGPLDTAKEEEEEAQLAIQQELLDISGRLYSRCAKEYDQKFFREKGNGVLFRIPPY